MFSVLYFCECGHDDDDHDDVDDEVAAGSVLTKTENVLCLYLLCKNSPRIYHHTRRISHGR